MRFKAIKWLLIVIASSFTVKCWALEGEHNWGISPYLGLFSPSLKLLNEGEFHAPYEGTADIVDQFGNNNNVTVPFIFRTPIPELDPGALMKSIPY